MCPWGDFGQGKAHEKLAFGEAGEECGVFGRGGAFYGPEEYDSSWYIQISGRLETEGGGMSVHYLDEESEAGSWEKGRLYSFPVEEGSWSELVLYVSSGKEEAAINLLEYIPKE